MGRETCSHPVLVGNTQCCVCIVLCGGGYERGNYQTKFKIVIERINYAKTDAGKATKAREKIVYSLTASAKAQKARERREYANTGARKARKARGKKKYIFKLAGKATKKRGNKNINSL